MTDIKSRYKRTVIGPFWVTLGTGIIVLVMGFIWGSLLKIPLKDFLPYIASGLIIWSFISSIIGESCTAFTSQTAIIHNTKVPLVLHIFTLISRNFIIMLHNFIVFIVVFFLCGSQFSFSFFLVIPGFVLLILNIFWISLFVSIVATRFRDMAAIISYIMVIAMISTPIMWKPEVLQGDRRFLALLNPLTHLINVVRDPLLNQVPSFLNYAVTISFFIFGSALSLFLYKKYMHRIIYWM